MSEILNNFNRFSKVSSKLKKEIRTFHVFDDKKGYNVLFITNDDNVFGFGYNTDGCCGLGHNSVVIEPKYIPELSNKNIKQFFIGGTFVLALSGDLQLYGWGSNDCGQLGRGPTNNVSIYSRPEFIDFKNETIIEVSCGSLHSLLLTLEGSVYGWGDNEFGQIGCGKDKGESIAKPIRLKFFENILIKNIYCAFNRSFVLTNNGLVYSWGWNKWCSLGHDLNENEYVFEPKLINISNVISVGPSSINTYFLTNEGLIYFCGLYKDENNCEIFQKIPKLMNREMKFSSLHSVSVYKKHHSIASIVSETQIYLLNLNKVSKTKDNEFFKYYINEWNVCHKTIQIFDYNNYKESGVILAEKGLGRKLNQIGVLGAGAYGIVYKVQNNSNKELFALKKIYTECFSDDKNKKLMREVNTLSQCSPEYVVQYFDSWFENNFFYIKTELCSENLRNVIDRKGTYFGRQQNQPMNTIEYLISCQLFKEVLECVQYLHESKIMHRDLKPANILITQNPSKGRFLKLCDFGLAKVIDSDTTKTHTRDQGSRRYMAPEILIPNQNQKTKYNKKVDIYSLGVVGQDLFEFNSIDSSNPLNNSLVIEKALKLNEIIKNMVNTIYSERPTCAQVLSLVNDWSISLDDLIESDFCYEDVFISDSFFKTYFNTILLRNVFPNNSNQSYDKSLSSDVTFVVSGQQITCNKHILIIKNKEFEKLLKNNSTEDIIINELHPDAFRKMIDYLYYNKDSTFNDINEILELIYTLICAQKFKITPLMELIKTRLLTKFDLDKFEKIYDHVKKIQLHKIL